MNNRTDDSRRKCVPASRSDIMALSGPSRGRTLPDARALFIPNNRQHRGAQGKTLPEPDPASAGLPVLRAGGLGGTFRASLFCGGGPDV